MGASLNIWTYTNFTFFIMLSWVYSVLHVINRESWDLWLFTIYFHIATGRWFSAGHLVSSTSKTDCHDIAEILLKVALNTIKQTNKQTLNWLWQGPPVVFQQISYISYGFRVKNKCSKTDSGKVLVDMRAVVQLVNIF
jgi:cytochrome c1